MLPTAFLGVLASVVATSAQFTVKVGVAADGSSALQYTPANFSAPRGSTITFEFAPGDHSVTQSIWPWGNACVPAPGGFDSGIISVPAGSTDPAPTFKLTVLDEETLWFFSKQPGNPLSECRQGMVGAVNAPRKFDSTFGIYLHNAIAHNQLFPSDSTVFPPGAATTIAPGSIQIATPTGPFVITASIIVSNSVATSVVPVQTTSAASGGTINQVPTLTSASTSAAAQPETTTGPSTTTDATTAATTGSAAAAATNSVQSGGTKKEISMAALMVGAAWALFL